MRSVALVSLFAALSLALGARGGPGASTPRDGCPPGPALLALNIDDPPDRCLHPGEFLHVTLAVSCIEVPLTGYQAFLQFDTDALTFVDGSYVLPDPFGLPLVYPITAADGQIDLASGVNPFTGQPPTQVDAELAHLVFQANSVMDVTQLRFRVNEPETRVSTLDGPLIPALWDSLTVLVRPCTSCLWTDLNCDDVVDLADFVAFSDCMHGPDVLAPATCAPADLDDDADVDLHDFAEFQRSFAGTTP